ncbi:MAG: glycosyltransferase family 9 protein [Planctomycetes bacterium]|nr:glycosyltransferase family 9 protein [Planctomycetota bacterium]
MNSILLVRLSAMGDLVQGIGAVRALHAVRPDLAITIVTQAPFAPLLDGLPGVRRVVPFRRDGGLAALWQVRAALRADRYDLALDLQGNWKSALVARLSGARRRIGAEAAARQEPASRMLLHRTVAVDGPPHPARIAWHLVREVAPGAPFLPPRLVAAPAELAAERAAVAAAGIDPARPFRVVVATDPADPRALRPAVVDRLVHAATGPALLLVGPAEAGLVLPPGVPVLRHGRGEPRRLIALGAVIAAADGRVVAPDTGAVHVLAAAGAACEVRFGSEDPRRTAPPTATALVHAAPPGCAPCRQRRCTHANGPVCMEFDAANARIVPLGLPPSSPGAA